VTSALEVFYVMRYINPRFTYLLLTYLLTFKGQIKNLRPTFDSGPMYRHAKNFPSLSRNEKKETFYVFFVAENNYNCIDLLAERRLYYFNL